MASDTIIREKVVADFLGGKPFVEGEKMKLALSLILLLPALSWAGWPVSGNKSAVQCQAHFLAKKINATKNIRYTF